MKTKGVSAIVWIIVAVLGLAFLTQAGGFDLGSLSTGSILSTTGTGTGQGEVNPAGAQKLCGDDNLADLQTRFRNGLITSSSDWGSATLSLIDDSDGSIIQSTRTAANGDYATSSNLLACGKKYSVAVVNNATLASAKFACTEGCDSEGRVASAQVKFDAVGANATNLNSNLYDLDYSNDTNQGSNSINVVTVDNHALNSGDSVVNRYDMGVNTTGRTGQFGSMERLCETSTGACGKAFVCITGSSSIYGAEDISIGGEPIIGKANAIPQGCSILAPTNAGTARTAYELTTWIDGRKSGTYTIKSGLANAADTDNVRFTMQDMSYFNDNGKLKAGTVDRALADVGVVNTYFEADIT